MMLMIRTNVLIPTSPTPTSSRVPDPLDARPAGVGEDLSQLRLGLGQRRGVPEREEDADALQARPEAAAAVVAVRAEGLQPGRGAPINESNHLQRDDAPRRAVLDGHGTGGERVCDPARKRSHDPILAAIGEGRDGGDGGEVGGAEAANGVR